MIKSEGLSRDTAGAMTSPMASPAGRGGIEATLQVVDGPTVTSSHGG